MLRTFPPAAVLATAISMMIPLSVQAQSIECDISTNDRLGWVPPWLVFSVNEGNGTVTTLDPVTFSANETTATAKLRVSNDRRWEFKWTTGNLSSTRKDQLQMTYSVVYLKRKKAMRIYAKPRGYHNDFTGGGPCKPSTRKLN